MTLAPISNNKKLKTETSDLVTDNYQGVK